MWLQERELIKDWLHWEIKEEDMNKPLTQMDEWDSFNIVQFMAEMDDNYGAKVTIEDLADIELVEDLIIYINKRRKNNVSNKYESIN